MHPGGLALGRRGVEVTTDGTGRSCEDLSERWCVRDADEGQRRHREEGSANGPAQGPLAHGHPDGRGPDCTVSHFTLPAFFSVTGGAKQFMMSAVGTPLSDSAGTTTLLMK